MYSATVKLIIEPGRGADRIRSRFKLIRHQVQTVLCFFSRTQYAPDTPPPEAQMQLGNKINTHMYVQYANSI